MTEGTEEVALKVIKATYPKKRARFLQEVSIHDSLSKQNMKNIIQLLEHNIKEIENGGIEGFIVMPMAETSLEKQHNLLIDRLELCLEIFEGVVNGINNAHESGIIHRDIKPANVLFMDSSLKEPLICDFGICLLREVTDEKRVTEVGETVGAKFFMAPEQERGGIADIKPSADIYSLGKLLCHMITGKYIYREEIREAFEEKQLTSNSRLRFVYENILKKTVLERPEERIQSAKELLYIVQKTRQELGSFTTQKNASNLIIRKSEDILNVHGTFPDKSRVSAIDEYKKYRELLSKEKHKIVQIEFDDMRDSFNRVWAKIYKSFENSPQDTKSAASQLIREQSQTMAISIAMARCNSIEIFKSFKNLLEYITRSSENKSGYMSVFTVPHALAGFLYMATTTMALEFESWEILSNALGNKFEWYYQSGRPIYNYGFDHPYFFHPEALKRSSPDVHDFF